MVGTAVCLRPSRAMGVPPKPAMVNALKYKIQLAMHFFRTILIPSIYRMLAFVSGRSRIPKGMMTREFSAPCGSMTLLIVPEFLTERGGTTIPGGENVWVKVAKIVPLRPATALTLSRVSSMGRGFLTVAHSLCHWTEKKCQRYILSKLTLNWTIVQSFRFEKKGTYRLTK